VLTVSTRDCQFRREGSRPFGCASYLEKKCHVQTIVKFPEPIILDLKRVKECLVLLVKVRKRFLMVISSGLARVVTGKATFKPIKDLLYGEALQ
jgi:hypothetical protein